MRESERLQAHGAASARHRLAARTEVVALHASFLAEASKRLASSLDYEATLKGIPALAVPVLADWCAVDILDEDGTIRRLASAHVDPAKQALGAELAVAYPPDPAAADGVPYALRTGSSALIPEVTHDLLAGRATGPEHLERLLQLGLVSEMVVPLVARGRTLGALTFATADSGRRYGEVDRMLAEELAGRCALAIDNARLYRAARGAVQLRAEFLAAVSHDLKTPLALISGQAQLLRRHTRQDSGPLASRVTEGLAQIESTVARMSRLIDDLLDVAHLELGQHLQLELQRVDLVALAQQRIAEHQRLTQRHLIRLAGESELAVDGDPARLERVLDNLLSNATKYSPEGGVITVVVARDDDEAGGWAVVAVRDQGVGIPDADLPRVFEHFHRAQNVGRIGGTGVGLAVASQIVAQHGGSLTVDSREGHGSTFTFRLPLRQTAPGA
jgi:signal transduction histidine kinase